MTREEERTKAAKDYADSIAQHEHNKLYSIDDFKAGAKWADKHPLDKTIKNFPELKESEKIRKTLIRFHKSTIDIDAIKGEDILAWLEKQGKQETDEWKEGNIIRHGGILALVIKGRRAMKSNGEIFTVQYPDEWVKASPNEIEHFLNEFEKRGEQKPFDYENATIIQKDFAPKDEPKFHEGEWIVWKNKYYKVNYNGCGYELIDQNGLKTFLEYLPIDNNAHLWSIKDARNGDVLVSQYSQPFIYNGHHNEYKVGSHYGIECTGEQFIDTYNEICWTDNKSIKPATKEQRDLLIAKMKEAGYAFDFEKKELKKIEQEPTECKEKKYSKCYVYNLTHNDEMCEQCKFNPKNKKPAEWSEEDDYNLQCMIAKVTSDIQKGNVGRNNELIDWLNSLKKRMGG